MPRIGSSQYTSNEACGPKPRAPSVGLPPPLCFTRTMQLRLHELPRLWFRTGSVELMEVKRFAQIRQWSHAPRSPANPARVLRQQVRRPSSDTARDRDTPPASKAPAAPVSEVGGELRSCRRLQLQQANVHHARVADPHDQPIPLHRLQLPAHRLPRRRRQRSAKPKVWSILGLRWRAINL
jgi:hypothetical protein